MWPWDQGHSLELKNPHQILAMAQAGFLTEKKKNSTVLKVEEMSFVRGYRDIQVCKKACICTPVYYNR